MTYEDGPEVDEHKEPEIELSMEREEVDENVVGDGLDEAVQRVEGVGGEGSRNWRYIEHGNSVKRASDAY